MERFEDIFAACELYVRLRERFDSGGMGGVDYRAWSDAEPLDLTPANPAESSLIRWLDPYLTLTSILEELAEDLGPRDWLIWAAVRLLGAETAKEVWAVGSSHGGYSEGAVRGRWQSTVRTGDYLLGRLLERADMMERLRTGLDGPPYC